MKATFILHADSPILCVNPEGGAGICNENLPKGWGILHLIKSNPLVCPTFAQEGGSGAPGRSIGIYHLCYSLFAYMTNHTTIDEQNLKHQWRSYTRACAHIEFAGARVKIM